jgi:RNA polymerase sigma factor (sigma-70 family)
LSEPRARLVALLGQVGAGRADALEQLYALTSAKLFGVCLRMTGDRGGAEDALQDSFVKIWRKAALYDEAKASPITWMCTIARNTAIDWKRANAVVTEPDDGEDASERAVDSVDMEAELVARSTGHHILDCIARLDPQQGRAVKTAFYDGLTHSELATHMNVPLGTVKSWIRRALAALKECIDDAA